MQKLMAWAGPVTDRLARVASQSFDERESQKMGEAELGTKNLEKPEIPWWYKNMTDMPDPLLRRGTLVYLAKHGVTFDWCKNRKFGDDRASTMIFEDKGDNDTACIIEEDI